MLCEMCGKDVVATSRVRIEGTVLPVCPDCAKFGQPVDPAPVSLSSALSAKTPTPGARGARIGGARRRLEERDLYQEIGELELAPDWARRVRLAREARVWTPEELGKKLNEKKSIVLKIESGNFHPSDELVRKLEHLLKIRLRAEEGATSAT
ncbi:MAG TPA: multiprotein bridging factor aMBF1 [Thermoplasmata archaeon]|nr:multiprotein bridging factor aMBF1 [Thermoplasmata archaeon]